MSSTTGNEASKEEKETPKCCCGHVSTQRLMGDSSFSPLCGFANSTNVHEQAAAFKRGRGSVAGWGQHLETLCVCPSLRQRMSREHCPTDIL